MPEVKGDEEGNMVVEFAKLVQRRVVVTEALMLVYDVVFGVVVW